MIKFALYSLAALVLVAGCHRPLNTAACANRDGASGGCPQGQQCIRGNGWSQCVPVDAGDLPDSMLLPDVAPISDQAQSSPDASTDITVAADTSAATDAPLLPEASVDQRTTLPDTAPQIDQAGCIPSCAGKSCGDLDGCGGHCTAQTCSSGQRCVSGSCQCDSTSCPSGCCSGNQCFTGTTDQQCGIGGGLCGPCGNNTTCANHSCAACGAPGQVCCAGNSCQVGVATCMNGLCASSNVWAVGSTDDGSGAVARWSGNSWMLTPVTNTSNLAAIWGIDATHIWAVGNKNAGIGQYHGVSTQWNGTTWSAGTEVTGSDGNTVFGLFGVWGSSSTDLWAVGVLSRGGIGQVSRGNGSTWADASNVSDKALHGVSGTSTNDVWAVSDSGLWHWQGGAWSGPMVPPGMAAALLGVWANASSDVWVVGNDDSGTAGMTAHWTGTGWMTRALTGARQLFAVWGSASNDVWTVGLSTDQLSGVASHYNGSSWSPTTAVAGTSGLNAVWNSGPKDIWVAGNCGSTGCMVHGDGSGWSPPMTVPGSTLFTGLCGIAR